MSEILDVATLSRAQFGLTTAFHILFPTLTIGMSAFLVLLEALWLKTGRETYKRLYKFWIKIFALAFAMGVVTGIVLSFEFGTNFSLFSEAVAPVLGPLISVEVLTAFFVEAGFIGVMLFGWERVGRVPHFLATIFVSLGMHNSAFWILAANSWMHTPLGFELVDGLFLPTDWWAVIFNPSMPYRVAHMVAASYLTGAFVVAGVSAYHLLRGIEPKVARLGLSFAVPLAAVLAPVQLLVGDMHGMNVREHQPMKVAAMEGIWETGGNVPLLVFAIPDQEAQRNHLELGIPNLASLILTHDPHGVVAGLDQVRPEDRPPVFPVFWSFRLMVGLGLLMVALGGWGLVQRLRGRLYEDKLLQRLYVAAIPAGFVATVAGWIVTEVGRQPYTVYGILRTADSLSPVPAASVLWSLTLFTVVYILLFAAFLYYVHKVVRGGPPKAEDEKPVNRFHARGAAGLRDHPGGVRRRRWS